MTSVWAVRAAWLIVVAVGAATFLLLRDQPFHYDAFVYHESALHIREHGLLSEWSSVRTYGLPLVFSWTISAADVLRVGPIVTLFALQWCLFVGSSWLAARSLIRSDRERLLIFVAVAANPLLVVYTVHALTEALTLSCVLLAVAALGQASRSRRPTLWLFVGALASAFAVEVRPANLLIPVCYALAAAVVVVQRNAGLRPAAIAVTAAAVAGGLVVPLVPQVVVNQHVYKQATPLPVFDLAGLQAREGVRLVRYATNVNAGCGTPELRFENPLDHPADSHVTTGEMVRYYATAWPEGPQTAALHVFSGLDPRPFLTYQTDFGTRYERVLQAFTVSLLLLAAVPLLVARQRAYRRADILFLGAATLCSVGVLATSAAEYRFGIVAVTTMSIMAAIGAARVGRLSRAARLTLALALPVVLLAWMRLSDAVLETSAVWERCR